jgi:hypothetical protein
MQESFEKWWSFKIKIKIKMKMKRGCKGPALKDFLIFILHLNQSGSLLSIIFSLLSPGARGKVGL